MTDWVHQAADGKPWHQTQIFDPPTPKSIHGKGFPPNRTLTRKRMVLMGLAAFAALASGVYDYHRAAMHAALAKTYRITEIAPLPGYDISQGWAINASGQVTGRALVSYSNHSPLSIHGFVWKNGQVTDLGGVPGFARSSGIALNNAGQVVGVLQKSGPNWKAVPHGSQSVEPARRGFQIRAGKMTEMPLPPGCAESIADGINDQGQIAGTAYRPNSPYGQGFFYSQGRFTLLGRVGPLGSHLPLENTAAGINQTGQIVGTSITPGGFDSISHAFLYDRVRIHELERLPGFEDSIGTAINTQGQITGFASKEGPGFDYGGPRRAFLWQKGRIKNLGILPGFRDSVGTTLNTRGAVVGYAEALPLLEEWFQSHLPFSHYSAMDPPCHAFFYQDGQMFDLNDLVPADTGWVLETADGINDHGQIVGTGKHHGKTRAFLLTPSVRPE